MAEGEELTSKAETGVTWWRIPEVEEGGWGGAMLEDEELEVLLWEGECDIWVRWEEEVGWWDGGVFEALNGCGCEKL